MSELTSIRRQMRDNEGSCPFPRAARHASTFVRSCSGSCSRDFIIPRDAASLPYDGGAHRSRSADRAQRGIIVKERRRARDNYSGTPEITPSKVDPPTTTTRSGEAREITARPPPLQEAAQTASASKACRSARGSQTRRSRASPHIATASPASTCARGCSASIRRASSSRT